MWYDPATGHQMTEAAARAAEAAYVRAHDPVARAGSAIAGAFNSWRAGRATPPPASPPQPPSAPPPSASTTVTPEEVQAVRESGMEAYQLRKAGTVGSMQAIAGRTPRSVLAGMFAAGGRQEAMRNQAMFNISLNRALRFQNQYADALAQAAKDQAEGRPIQQQHQAAVDELTRLHVETAKWEKKLHPSLRQQLGNFGAVFGSMVAYSVGMKTVGVALGSVMPTIERWADSFTGFRSANAKVTAALAPAARTTGGRVDQVVADRGVQMGLSGDAVNLLVSQLALGVVGKAAAMAQGEVTDLFKAASGKAATGLYGGYGGILGSSLLAEGLGGGRGFTEQIRSGVNNMSGRNRSEGINIGPLQLGRPEDFGDKISLGLQYLTDETFRKGIDAATPPSSETPPPPDTRNFFEKVGDFLTPWETWSPQPTEQQSLTAFRASERDIGAPGMDAAYAGMDPRQAKLTKEYLADLGTAANRAAKATGAQEKVTWELTASQTEMDRAARAAAAANDPQGFAAALEGLVVKVNGEIADTREEYQSAVELTAKGRTMPDLGTWAKSLSQAIKASRESTLTQTRDTIETDIPAQLATQLAMKPLPTRRQLETQLGYNQATGAAKADIGRRITSIQRTQGGLQEQADAGKAQMVERIQQYGEPGQVAEFNQYWSEAVSYGKQIVALQTKIASINMAQRAKEFASQMILAKRALADALGMAGRGGSRYGQLGRQDYFLGRESQAISMGLQQKQINFQVATAGFTSNGQTAEELAARQDQTVIEASYAQKQLDIEKERFGISLQMFNISNERAVADAKRSRELLQASYENEKRMQAIVSQIAIKEIAQTQAMNKAQAIYQGATNNYREVLGQATQYVAQFGGTIRDATVALRRALGIGGGGDSQKRNAAGFFGTVTGPTEMLMGEAGTETVAILRNPRVGTMAAPQTGGGGTWTVTINFQGDVNVREDNDINRIAAAVEARLNQRVSLLGLRRPGG